MCKKVVGLSLTAQAPMELHGAREPAMLLQQYPWEESEAQDATVNSQHKDARTSTHHRGSMR